MKVNISKKGTFIPEWNGNKDLPEEEQIKVHFRYLNVQERKRYTTQHPWEVDGQGNFSFKLEHDDKAIFQAMTETIENLSIEDENGNTKEVKTADDLLNARGLDELFQEIWTHYFSSGAVNTKN